MEPIGSFLSGQRLKLAELQDYIIDVDLEPWVKVYRDCYENPRQENYEDTKDFTKQVTTGFFVH